MSKMSKNGQICYFQHFLGVQWKKLPQSTGLPWKTLTPKILPNFVLVFYIYCYYAISVWDFKIHRDGHNHGGQHRSPEFLGGSSDWGPVDSGCHKLSENIWFVWSKRSYSGQKVGCDDCDTHTHGHTDGNVKIELESSKQDSQWYKYRNYSNSSPTCCYYN